ncbi:hypothetical protein Pcinc_010877 [Petrolisthes cinctipes]|uniref:Endonuclease/exonuclease/phosphatase domain-containing protein n=1 Tax=Petrolisthes cinctipes TaxID=88211 RepID=A0AAE1KV06_PETCI|nr:hypothetical protein Pcinc_010877 [Petrolisthes cinctipes]
MLENSLMGNIQGLYPKTNQSKVPFIGELAIEHDLMFIALTETHLKEEIGNAEIAVTNYTPFRADRENRSHGGVITYVRNDLAPDTVPLLVYSNGQVELLVIKIKSLNLLIFNCYRPPSCTLVNFTKAYREMHKLIEDLPTPMPDIIICGDFNFPFIHWPEGSIITGATREEQDQASLTFELSDKFFLTQLITKPTRKNNTIDLLFTNIQDLLSDHTVEKTIFSDHNLVHLHTRYRKAKDQVDTDTPPSHNRFSALNFDSEAVNWSDFHTALTNKNWDHILSDKDPNAMLDTMLNTILSECQFYVPKRRKPALARHLTIPRDRKILMRKRSSLLKQLDNARGEERKLALSIKIANIESKLKESHEHQRQREENRAIENIKRNPKFFCSYCRRFSKIKTKVGPLRTELGESVNDHARVSQVLKEQYERVFSKPKPSCVIRDPASFFTEDIGLQDHLTNGRRPERSHQATESKFSSWTRWNTCYSSNKVPGLPLPTRPQALAALARHWSGSRSAKTSSHHSCLQRG